MTYRREPLNLSKKLKMLTRFESHMKLIKFFLFGLTVRVVHLMFLLYGRYLHSERQNAEGWVDKGVGGERSTQSEQENGCVSCRQECFIFMYVCAFPFGY